MFMVSNPQRDQARRRRDALEKLLETTTLIAEGMDSDAAARGLTVARAEVIWLLHHDGPMRQRDLAEKLRVSPRNVTGLLDALERTGFVTRGAHPSDRRATLVRLTEAGKTTTTALVAGQDAFASYLFSGLDREELERLATALDKLLERLRDEGYSRIRQAALGGGVGERALKE